MLRKGIEAMDREELKAGKERVQVHLIDVLNAKGMERKRSIKVEEFEKTLDSLRARLAYMGVEQLQALAWMVERMAEGKRKNAWPAEVSICNWARRIQPPPPSDSPMVCSVMKSAMGRLAVAGGYERELYLFLKKHGYPPNEYALGEIRNEGEANSEKLLGLLGRSGALVPDDAAWLEWYQNGGERVQAVIGNKFDEVAA